MKFNTKVPGRLYYYFLREVALYKSSFKEGNLLHAWEHLERAHIIGQAYPFTHSYAHFLMLKFGLAI